MRSSNSTGKYVIVQSLSSTTQLYKVTVQNGSNSSTQDFLLHSVTSGLWRSCDSMSDAERSDPMIKALNDKTVTIDRCFVYVTDYDEDNPNLDKDGKQIARLHNSAASCYVVVLIDLAAAVAVGAAGVYHKQVASVMVTGVLYFMASLFGIFGLVMYHTKHYYQKSECKCLDRFPKDELCQAMLVELLYGVPLAWIGVILCLVACGLWLVLARALRIIMVKTML